MILKHANIIMRRLREVFIKYYNLHSYVVLVIIITFIICIIVDTTLGNVPVQGKCSSTGTNCVRSCANQPNGDYQSCDGCDVYVTCSNGLTYDNRPCPSKIVWNDKIKACDWTSPTCVCLSKC